MFELARHWARRSGVSERKEDLESVSAKKILVVTIEVVDVLVGVGVASRCLLFLLAAGR